MALALSRIVMLSDLFTAIAKGADAQQVMVYD
jgi:hypothetical protein